MTNHGLGSIRPIRLVLATFWLLTGCPGSDAGRSPGLGGEGGAPIVCDEDGDGHDSYNCGGDDCDDGNRYVRPGAEDACGDGMDQDCSGVPDEGCDCVPGEYRSCYPPGLDHPSRRVGTCLDGLQRCGTDGKWEDACEGAVVPADEGETIDGLDQDCDGVADGGLLNRCGVPGPLAAEVCGNGLDDDCDGRIDPADLCSLHCGWVDPLDPPEALACCVVDPDDRQISRYPVRHSRLCAEAEGFPACASEERECKRLAEGAACSKLCRDTDGDGTVDRCLCGVDRGGAEPEASEACGFETPCVREDCADRQNQPCYSGPPSTLGVGVCRAGLHSCEADDDGSRAWSSCAGEVLPGIEVCGNGVDDDCDGAIDEADGATGRSCGLPACAPGAAELCGNGLDDDCDGLVDEGCRATASQQACFSGPPAVRNRGACRDGVQRAENGNWGPCTGDVLPAGETCGDGVDSDCNGAGGPGEPEDGGCCVATAEVCDGRDQDCDGVINDGVADACGSCEGACAGRSLADPADCAPGHDRACSGLEPVPGDPSAVVLRLDKREGPAEEVLHLNVGGGILQFSVTQRRVNWVTSFDFTTYGGDPRAVATAADNSVWQAARGTWGADGAIRHVSAGGSLLCVREGKFTAVAIDPEGTVWAAASDAPRLHRFDPELVSLVRSDGSPYPDGTPRCEPIDLEPGSTETALTTPFVINGLAVDRRGILWGSRRDPGDFGNENILRLDTLTLERTVFGASFPRMPAIAGNGDVWFSRCEDYGDQFGVCAGGLVRVDGDGPYQPDGTGSLPYQDVYPLKVYRDEPEYWIAAVVVDDHGHVWGSNSSGPGYRDPVWVVRYRPGTQQTEKDVVLRPLETQWGGGALAVDSSGGIWTAGQAASSTAGLSLARLDPGDLSWEVLPSLPFSLHVTKGSDLTGISARRRGAPVGRWIEAVDAGWNDAEWVSVDWQEYEPAGTEVGLAVRFAPTREALVQAPVACRFAEPLADLAACGDARRNRYMSVEFELTSGDAGGLPMLRDIRVDWTRR